VSSIQDGGSLSLDVEFGVCSVVFVIRSGCVDGRRVWLLAGHSVCTSSSSPSLMQYVHAMQDLEKKYHHQSCC
jgi:hypothetical protein